MSNYNEFMFEEAFEFHMDKELKVREDGDKIEVEQRVPPLGACSNELNDHQHHEEIDLSKYGDLQENNDQLNSSLFALTSHFAQVQFRLKQIINGPKVGQEKLLSELEEFAFAGCPDVVGPNEKKISACSSCISHHAIENYEQRIADEKEREKRLDAHLKQMIANLESSQKKVDKKPFRYHNKKGYEKTTTRQHSKSTYMFPEQNNQLEISDNEDDTAEAEDGILIPPEDMKKHIDQTMAKLINPKKAKDNIINQVSKQIHDMEKFVDFLKGYESTTEVETDHESEKKTRASLSKLKLKNTAPSKQQSSSASSMQNSRIPAPHAKSMLDMNQEKRRRIHHASVAVIKKSIAVLQIFAISQFGCSARHFQEHMMRKSYSATSSRSEYEKPYETLRTSIDQILALHTKLIDNGGLHPDSEDELNIPLSTTDKRASWSRSNNRRLSRQLSRADSVSSQSSNRTTLPYKSVECSIQEDLIRAVRGEFCTALKSLLQHGLVQSFQSSGLSTKALVGCMSSQTSSGIGLHVWEYFNMFYKLKHGDQFNTQPSMMLSEAFGMDVGCTQQNPKQSLLTVLHRIKTTHETRKRSFDAMFKALVSAGLNRGRLAQWIRLVVRCPELVERHYERWSYVVKSGFDEVLTSLEKLSSLTFFLPEDLAIRHLLKNINEFGDA